MRTIKQAIIILLVLLLAGNVASYFYLGTSERQVPPKITCPDEVLELSASDNESVLLNGVTAFDQQDGDLTARITIAGISKLVTNDTAKATLIVFDSDDNMASCTRRIRYTDYHRPTFSVTEPLVYSSTEEVALLSRLKATDVVDGDISKNIRVSTLEPSNNSPALLSGRLTTVMLSTRERFSPLQKVSSENTISLPTGAETAMSV